MASISTRVKQWARNVKRNYDEAYEKRFGEGNRKYNSQWYNYDTQEYVSTPMLESDESAMKALPEGAARGLYTCHRELGDDIATAFMKVSYKLVGEEYQEDKS